MRLGQLQKRPLITEGWNDPQLTLMEQKIIHPWVARVEQYVFEANLTADQINQLFTSVEQGATAAGGNRTAIGKGVDVAKLPVKAVKWIDDKINELGRMAQNAGPVKNADQKFEELKQQIGSKDSKVVNAIKSVSDWAKANPGKASIAVGILTAAAALAAGPLGGAVAGFLARATKDLLQGEKLSTAVGKSVKTAAYGALVGAAIQGISDNIIDNIAAASEAEADAMLDQFQNANFTAAVDKAVADAGFESGVLDGAQNLKMSGNINAFNYSYDLTMTPDQVAQYKALSDAASSAKAFSPEYYEAAGKLHGFLSTTQEANADLTALAKTIGDIPKDQLTGPQMDAAIAVLDNADAAIEKIMDIGGGAAAAAQGALQTVDDNAKNMHNAKPISPEEKAELEGGEAPKESKVYKGQKLSEGQIYLLFDRLTNVNNHMLENKLMFESVFDAVAYYNRQTINEAEPAVAEPEAEAPAEKKPGFLGKIKQGAGRIAKGIKGAAKQITTKVTAEKLNRQWKEAGSPTDSDEIYDILKKAGVNDDVIKGTYDSMKIEVPAATDAPDGDKDETAADSETNADSPTDSTAGDEGSSTTDTGAADTNAGGDDTAATDDTADDTADDADALGKAKEQRAIRLGRGLSPEEEAQVEKEFNQSKKATANKNPAVEPGTKVIVKTKTGKDSPGTTTAGDIGQYDPKTHVMFNPDGKGGDYPAPVASMTTPDGKPVATTATQEPAASGEEPAQTGTTDTNTASTSGGQGADDTTTPQTTEPATQDGAGGKTPAQSTDTTTTKSNTTSTNTPGTNNTTTGQTTPAQTKGVDINLLATSIKDLGPKITMDVRNSLEKEVKAA